MRAHLVVASLSFYATDSLPLVLLLFILFASEADLRNSGAPREQASASLAQAIQESESWPLVS